VQTAILNPTSNLHYRGVTLNELGHVLDLEQVLELCMNAAGGSTMLAKFGRALLDVLRSPTQSATVALHEVATPLRQAVEEAQRLKLPLFLGNQALRIVELAEGRDHQGSLASLVKVWET